jgi:hypothetical protein
MLLEVLLMVHGFVNSDCYTDGTNVLVDKGYIETKTVVSLTPEQSCKHVNYCLVRENDGTKDGLTLIVKSSCETLAKRIHGR